MGIGKVEIILIIIAVVLILFFGARKLPEWGRSIGQTGKELKKGFRDGLEDDAPKKNDSDSEKKA